jgi:hypothetical protein
MESYQSNITPLYMKFKSNFVIFLNKSSHDTLFCLNGVVFLLSPGEFRDSISKYVTNTSIQILIAILKQFLISFDVIKHMQLKQCG